MEINDSFIVNIILCSLGKKVEVVTYKDFNRKVLNVFEGDEAEGIAALLLNPTTYIPETVRYEDNIPKVLTKRFIFPEEKREVVDG